MTGDPLLSTSKIASSFRYEPGELFPGDSEGLPTSVWKRRPSQLYQGLRQKYGQAYDH